MVNQFYIYSPVLGMFQNYPHIFLNKAVTKENTDIQIIKGEIHKRKKRAKELTRTQVAVTNTSGNTITLTGNYVSYFPAGANISIYNLNNDYQDLYINTTGVYDSTSTVLTATTSITIADPQYVYNAEDVLSTDPADNDFLKVTTPDDNPILRYDNLRQSSGTNRLIAYTKDHIYYWNTALTRWDVIFTCSSSCTYWDSAQYGDYIVATNNIDKPVQWDGNPANNFEDMDTYITTSSVWISKAEFVTSYQNYVIFGNYSLSSGSDFKHNIIYSNIGYGVSTDGFRQDTGGDAGSAVISGDGDISGGFGEWQGYLIVFKRNSMRKLWYTASTTPFSQDNLSSKIGCSAPGSVCKGFNDELYYYGSDKYIREISSGIVSEAVYDVVKNVNSNYINLIRSIAINEYKEIMWSIPYGSGATANNKIVVLKDGKWDTLGDVSIATFGSYIKQDSYTWETGSSGSWETWAGTWDSSEGAANEVTDICSDVNGCTYSLHNSYLDDGVEYTSSFELSTDLGDTKSLAYYKRISNIYVYVRNENGGSIDLSVKKDNEQTYTSIGSVTLSGSEDILRKRVSKDVRARHFLFKIDSEDMFRFLGMEIEYEYSGTR